MITEFGKMLRKIRIDNGEILKNMADKLNVSSSYLSSIEVGKRRVPNQMVEEIGEKYDLSIQEIEELQRTADMNEKIVKMNLNEREDIQKKAALVFARNFENMDKATAKKIIEMFGEEK